MKKIFIGLLLVVLASFAVTNTATAATTTMPAMEFATHYDIPDALVGDFSDVLAHTTIVIELPPGCEVVAIDISVGGGEIIIDIWIRC